MLFSSPLFLFLFLPLFGLVYALTPNNGRNLVLLLASLLFYAWGEPKFIFVVIAATAVDYVAGAKIAASENPGSRKRWVGLAVAVNLGVLVYFKYTNFFVDNINTALAALGMGKIPWLAIALPIGVSFVVFEKITYVVDIYRGKGHPADSFLNYLLYVLFFPKLMAGPIIKYHDIEEQFRSRTTDWEGLRDGVVRFTIGFAKKTLVADTVGHFANQAFGVPLGGLDALTAWVGLLCFAVQIYFDFAGYSDMAIGLARCLGFHLRENFNNPYISQNFTEFWQRWHISLSSWIKEYLYIPLGGNRRGPGRTYFNLWFCFLMSGLWHGASWMFLIWGAYHGVMLVIERLWWLDAQKRVPAWFNRALTFVLVIFGWIPFRAESLGHLADYTMALFRPARVTAVEITGEIWLFLGIGLALCFLPVVRFDGSFSKRVASVFQRPEFALCLTLVLFWVAAARMASSSYQAFIYFRF